MRPGKSKIYLITATFDIDEVETPEFGISFDIPDMAHAQALGTKPTLQLRRFEQGGAVMVDSFPFVEMPIYILEKESRPFDKKSKKLKFKASKK